MTQPIATSCNTIHRTQFAPLDSFTLTSAIVAYLNFVDKSKRTCDRKCVAIVSNLQSSLLDKLASQEVTRGARLREAADINKVEARDKCGAHNFRGNIPSPAL